MVPARNLLRRHYDSYGGGCFLDPSPLLLTSPMADDHSKPAGPAADKDCNSGERGEEEEEEVGPSSSARSSRDGDGDGDSWLRLGIGSSSSAGPAARPELQLFAERPPPPPPPALPAAPRPMETAAMMMMPLFPQSQLGFRRGGTPWGFWSSSLMIGSGSGSPGPLPAPPPPPPLLAQPQYHVRRVAPAGVEGGVGELRVVSPPPRPQTGVWFVLQASQNQVREPFLPQIPKSYLRIKDGRMTVRLLMKYLVNKLGLEDESEVEISCRGQPLLPFLTLQHVRDNIWCLRDATPLLQESLSIDHVMMLHYGRSP